MSNPGSKPKQVSVSRDVAASPATVFAMVSDLSRMGEWSPEATGGDWVKGSTGPALGAKFKGRNHNGSKNWTTMSTVTRYEPDRVFEFDVVVGPIKVAFWRFEFEAAGTGCRVTETWVDNRPPFVGWIGKIVSGVADRAPHNRIGMERTLEALARAV